MEVWKDVPGCEGLYQASTLGRVQSQARGPSRVLKPCLKGVPGHKRLSVSLYVDGVRTNRLVHQLVLETFVGPRPEGMQGCHNDGNPLNNGVSNLRWDTQKGNFADKKLHGTERYGSTHGQAKLADSDVLEIRRRLAVGESQRSVAKDFKITQAMVSSIHLRKRWTHL